MTDVETSLPLGVGRVRLSGTRAAHSACEAVSVEDECTRLLGNRVAEHRCRCRADQHVLAGLQRTVVLVGPNVESFKLSQFANAPRPFGNATGNIAKCLPIDNLSNMAEEEIAQLVTRTSPRFASPFGLRVFEVVFPAHALRASTCCWLTERFTAPFKALTIASPTAQATGGGKAFPTCRYAAVFLPENSQLSGKPWILAAIRTVRRGIPVVGKSGSGGLSARLRASTPSSLQASRARVGPRSGPPCRFEPPTSVGATPSALSAQVVAPRHPREAMRSRSALPTVGGVPTAFGHAKRFAPLPRIATRTKRGRSWGTPKLQAFSTCQSTAYPH